MRKYGICIQILMCYAKHFKGKFKLLNGIKLISPAKKYYKFHHVTILLYPLLCQLENFLQVWLFTCMFWFEYLISFEILKPVEFFFKDFPI